MQKGCLLILLALIAGACRKDNSAFLGNEKIQTSIAGCFLSASFTQDEKNRTTASYELDSVITQLISTEEGNVTDAKYLQVETPKQFLSFSGSKNLTNAKSRIYLNEDGAISKEIAVIPDSAGLTVAEDSTRQNIFTYNSKKQLVKVEVSLENEGVYDFTYDDKNRIQKIVVHDGKGSDLFIYDNFSYDEHVKNDNSLSLALFNSLSSYLIPSLRNVYIKGYALTSPLAPLVNKEVKMSYTFSENKLTEIMTIIIPSGGIPEESRRIITLNCQ